MQFKMESTIGSIIYRLWQFTRFQYLPEVFPTVCILISSPATCGYVENALIQFHPTKYIFSDILRRGSSCGYLLDTGKRKSPFSYCVK